MRLGHRAGSHIDRSTGRNKRDNTRREDLSQSPRRWNGRIEDRAGSARKMKTERALRRKGR